MHSFSQTPLPVTMTGAEKKKQHYQRLLGFSLANITGCCKHANAAQWKEE
jgi:hypothetical protein